MYHAFAKLALRLLLHLERLDLHVGQHQTVEVTLRTVCKSAGGCGDAGVFGNAQLALSFRLPFCAQLTSSLAFGHHFLLLHGRGLKVLKQVLAGLMLASALALTRFFPPAHRVATHRRLNRSFLLTAELVVLLVAVSGLRQPTLVAQQSVGEVGHSQLVLVAGQI